MSVHGGEGRGERHGERQREGEGERERENVKKMSFFRSNISPSWCMHMCAESFSHEDVSSCSM